LIVISNASPLIYLAKVNRLHLLKDLFEKIIIPMEVYDEVVTRGLKDSFSDARIVENAVKNGWIEVVKLSESIRKNEINFKGLDYGEIAVLKLAGTYSNSLVLIDDASARKIAESLGYNVKGTLYVILLAVRKKIISKKIAHEIINRLISSGFRISIELYLKVIESLGHLTKS